MKVCIFLLVTVATPVWAGPVKQEPPLSMEWQWQETKDGDREYVFRNGVKTPADEPNVTQRQEDSNKDPPSAGKEFPVNADPSPPRHKSYTEQARETVDWITTNEKALMVFFSGVLAVVGVLQFFSLIFQVIYGWRAASAAKKSAEVAAATLKLTQRAFVVAEQWRLRTDPRDPLYRVTGLVCTLRNVGHTHATIGDGALKPFKGLEIPPPPNLTLPVTRKGPFSIAAQETLEYTFPFTVTEWEQACPDLRSHEVGYFYGYISYIDALEPDKPRRMMFSVRFAHPKLQPTPVGEPGYNYTT